MSWPADQDVQAAAKVLGASTKLSRGMAERVARSMLETVGLPSPIGANEAAAILGTTSSNLPRWKDFPEPIFNGKRKLWDERAIVQFAAEREAARKASDGEAG